MRFDKLEGELQSHFYKKGEQVKGAFERMSISSHYFLLSGGTSEVLSYYAYLHNLYPSMIEKNMLFKIGYLPSHFCSSPNTCPLEAV